MKMVDEGDFLRGGLKLDWKFDRYPLFLVSEMEIRSRIFCLDHFSPLFFTFVTCLSVCCGKVLDFSLLLQGVMIWAS